MICIRPGTPFASGTSSAGFWLRTTLGRVIFNVVTSKVGERVSITAYLLCTIGLKLLFYLVPRFIVSAIVMAFLGSTAWGYDYRISLPQEWECESLAAGWKRGYVETPP